MTTPTLTQFVLEDLREHKDHQALLEILNDLAHVGKEISRHTNKAGLVGVLGAFGSVNIHEEEVTKLDVFANNLCKEVFTASPYFCALASEEEDGIVDLVQDGQNGDYIIAFDPLDGSSNTDVNVSIGTIFSVYKRLPDYPPTDERQFLQKGRDQVLAGYILYGSSTVLVFSFGNGMVHEFTLDPDQRDFYLSNKNIRIPQTASYYSVNEGNIDAMGQKDIDFINTLKKEYRLSTRYIGSLVADIHRNMLKGGIYVYPAIDKKGEGVYKGKLRVAFELKPIGFVIENAGGLAIDGVENVLDVESTSLHERRPLFIGNKDLVQSYLTS